MEGFKGGGKEGWKGGLIGKGWLNDGVMAGTVDGRSSIRIAGLNDGSRY